ncbi:hypothetical protein FH603_5400 [Spirosoma sp. LMG 31447]|uniref:Uncharacterized protein n=1 Tax=Spirosoma utsteinense TaxID=2585773 RepID=A0ABR6WE92_9BACT|nr:hypothetical protein [Spirosoma utsteinense]
MSFGFTYRVFSANFNAGRSYGKMGLSRITQGPNTPVCFGNVSE